jgi:hypothetical protein
VGYGFLDRRMRRVKERKYADIVAAVKSKRNLGLSQHLHGSTRQPRGWPVMVSKNTITQSDPGAANPRENEQAERRSGSGVMVG